LFGEGDDGHDVFVVLDGLVKVVTSSVSGREVILDLAGAGSLLGELSAIDGQPRSATAQAMTACEVLVVRVESFVAFLEGHPRAATELLRLVADRLRASSQRQLEFGTSDALGRLCRCILAMVDRFAVPSEEHVVLPVAQHEVAALTGLSREAVVKGLHSLRELGWIETHGRSVTILDASSLRARAGL